MSPRGGNPRPGPRRLVTLLAAVLLPAAAPESALAQGVVQPGGVATIVAAAAVPEGLDSVRFRMEPGPDVRVFGRLTGVTAVDASGSLRLPVTFGLPPSAPAGAFPVGRLHLVWPEGGDSVDLTIHVAARRGATFWVGAESVTASPGVPLEVGYRLRNRGNAADSFRVVIEAPAGWIARPEPAAVVVAAGDTAAGMIRLQPPVGAAAGEEHVFRVALKGREVREPRSFRVTVVDDEGWLGGVAHVPGSLFVGSSSGGDGLPGVALEAAGVVRPGTRLSLAVRHSDPLDLAPAFRGRLAGPRVRLGIETGSWGLRVGDIFTPAEILTGPVSQGRGGELEVRREDLSAALLVAAPLSYALAEESGLVLRAAGAVRTRSGRFGVTAGGVRRESPLFGAVERRGASLTWALDRAGHDVSVEAGLVEIAGDGAEVAGFAGEARYLFMFDEGSVTARLRKVPAVTRASAGQGDEAFVSGTVRVSQRTSILGWTFLSANPFAAGGPYAASRGGAAGVRARLPWGDLQGELLGSYRENRVVGDTLPGRITRSIRAAVDLPAGAITVELDAELGTATLGSTRPYHQVRTGARWSADGQWAWLGLYHGDSGSGASASGVDISGALVLRGVDVQGGLNIRFPGRTPAAAAFWSGANIPITRETSVTVGADHRPGDPATPWRFSLGASRTFGLPLPLARHPVLHGVVFEDLDGDHVRDPEEPPVEGITLRLGPLRATTDRKGEFRFHDAVRGDLRVDAGALPRGYIVPAEAHLPSTGRAEIPLIRTAALEIDVFLDRDGDGQRDPFDAAAAGAILSLRHADGRTRDEAADAEGRVRFGTLPPGSYTLLVHPPRTDQRPAPPLAIELRLEPGTTVRRTVALPLRTREVRIRDASSGA